jgi:hypothetical protein
MDVFTLLTTASALFCSVAEFHKAARDRLDEPVENPDVKKLIALQKDWEEKSVLSHCDLSAGNIIVNG